MQGGIEVTISIWMPNESKSRSHGYKRYDWADSVSYFRINYKSCFRSTSSAPPQNTEPLHCLSHFLRKERKDPVPSDSSSFQ